MEFLWDYLNWYPSTKMQLWLVPLLYIAGVVLLRYLFLLLAFIKVKDPKRRSRWKQASFYVALLAILFLITQKWFEALDRIVKYFGPAGPESQLRLTTLLESSYYAFLLGFVLLILFRIIKRIFQFLQKRLTQWHFTFQPFRFQGMNIIAPEQFQKILTGFLKLIYLVLIFLLLYFYIPLILSLFPNTQGLGTQLWGYVIKPAKEIGWAILNYLPNVVYLILIILVVRFIIKVAKFFLKGIENGQINISGFEKEWAEPTFKLFRVIALIFTLVIVYPFLPAAGSEIFKGFSIFVGAILTFGSSAAVGNILSGVLLTYSGSFNLGDFIKIGESSGYVVKRGLMVTKLKSLKNEEINVPNKVVLEGQVVNYSTLAQSKGLILSVTVGIGYDVDWAQVHKLLLQAAQATPNLMEQPEPFVRQDNLGDFAVQYELRVYTNQPDKMAEISSELRRNILKTFHTAGVEIMTPMVQGLRQADEPAIPNSPTQE